MQLKNTSTWSICTSEQGRSRHDWNPSLSLWQFSTAVLEVTCGETLPGDRESIIPDEYIHSLEKESWDAWKITDHQHWQIEAFKHISDCHVKGSYFTESGNSVLVEGVSDEDTLDILADIGHLLVDPGEPGGFMT